MQTPKRVGLQLYPYDVLDEGAEQVGAGAAKAGVNTLLLLVSFHEGNIAFTPGRAGDLLHNPRRQHHIGEAFFRPGHNEYPESLTPASSGPPGTDGAAALQELISVLPDGMEVVPWVTLLTQKAGFDAPQSCVVNARGEQAAAGWLCPSRPETIEFIRAVVRDIIEQSRCRAIFIDRIRFPEWGDHGLIDICSCFCERCQDFMLKRNVDCDSVRDALLKIVNFIERDPEAAATAAMQAFGSGFRSIRAATNRKSLLDWLVVRQEIVEELVIAAGEEASALGAELWLDVWPPSYGWLLGQDLTRLAKHASWVKPFTYHRWGGGADIAGLIASLSGDSATQQRLFEAFSAFFRFPGPDRFEDFMSNGLSTQFITSETVFARDMLAGNSDLAAGLQLWRSGADGVRSALESAWMASPDGVFFHCYGWASFEELEAAGQWLQEKARADSENDHAAV